MLKTQSLQTNMNQFVRVRKRPAADELPRNSKKFAGELLDPVKPSTPFRMSATRKLRKQSAEPSTPLEPTSCEEPVKQPLTPSALPVSQNTEKFSKENGNAGVLKKRVTRSKKCIVYKKKVDKLNSTRSRLDSIKESLNDLSDTKSKEADTSEVIVPTSSSKCDTSSTTEDRVTPVKVAAFEKYNHLLTTRKEGLILPYKYSVLEELFRWIDITTKVRRNRNELVTFTKLKRDMEQLSRKNFTESHLGQIKTVYPESYEFSCERIKITFSNEEKYELIIKRLSHSVSKNNQSEAVELTDSERLNTFHSRLLDITKTYHQEFLSKLQPPLILDSDKLKLWHPEFDLDSVPDIEPAPLPQPPIIQKYMSAKAILEKNHSTISVSHDTQPVIKTTPESDSTAVKSDKDSAAASTPNPIPAYRKILQKIPKSLLEKIRAKEAAKKAQIIPRTAEEAKEVAMLSRLPELARITRNIFVSEKKSVMLEEKILQKICFSYKEKLRINEAMEHLKLMEKHVPGWIIFITDKDEVPYIKLSKDADMTRVYERLQKLTNRI